MRIAVYAETSLLEAIARDPSLKDSYVSSYSFHFVLGKGDEPPAPVEGKWCCGEFELKLPSRDTAVMWAQPYNTGMVIPRTYRTNSWGVVAGLALEAA